VAKSAPAQRPTQFGEAALALRKAAHGALAKVSDAIEKLHFNVCVAHIYEFANAFGSSMGAIEAAPTPDYRWAAKEAADILVQLFHPMMPHLAEEAWAALGHKSMVATQAWPDLEPALLVENTITLPVAGQRQEARRRDGGTRRQEPRDRVRRAGARGGPARALDGKPPKK